MTFATSLAAFAILIAVPLRNTADSIEASCSVNIRGI